MNEGSGGYRDQQHDLNRGFDADPELSAAYRDIASERSPKNLDAKIMTVARREAKRGQGSPWREAWYRPASFIATAGLSLALILQFSDSGIFGTDDMAGDSLNGIVPATESAFQDAAERSAGQFRQLDVAPEQSLPMPQREDAAATTDVAPGDAGSLLPSDDRCDDEQRRNSTTWWQCIQALEKRGLTEAAEQELQALLRAHPQFAAPEAAPRAY